MTTFRITADIKQDRRLMLTRPPDVPTGQAELVVSIQSPASDETQRQPPRANGAETRTPSQDNDQARNPLRGSVARYERPTEPVAETDWEALPCSNSTPTSGSGG